MKRDPALITLSHDHHVALYVARTLKRATAVTASDGGPRSWTTGRSTAASTFGSRKRSCFPPTRTTVTPTIRSWRERCATTSTRARADALILDATPDPAILHELGNRLANHVRLEERQLFPLIEAALPTTRLATVAAALKHAEG